MENVKKHPITVDPKAGKTLSVVGDNYRVMVGGAETNGAFAAIDMLIPPNGGPGPHQHALIEETFYIVDGEITIKSEFGEYTATKGCFVNIPKGGVIHEFRNKTDKVAHVICMVVPAGLETFFEEIGEPVNYGEFLPPPSMDAESIKKLEAIAERHGQKVFPPDYFEKNH